MRRTTAFLLVALWILAAAVQAAPARSVKPRTATTTTTTTVARGKKAKPASSRSIKSKSKKAKKPAQVSMKARLKRPKKRPSSGSKDSGDRGGEVMLPPPNVILASFRATAPVPTPGALPEMVPPIAGLTSTDLRDSFSSPRGRGRLHRAIDIMRPEGTPLVACVDGIIEKLHTSASGGIAIYLLDAARRYRFYYAHLSAYAEGLAEGMPVMRGTLIGYVGSTGNASATAPHLHFQVMLAPESGHWGGNAGVVNPHPLLSALVEQGVRAEAMMPMVPPAPPPAFSAPPAALMIALPDLP